MFTPKRRIRLNDLEEPTKQNSGYFIAFIPAPDGEHTSTVIDHSANLIAQGYSYDPDSDTWQTWLGHLAIRTYRRYQNG